MTFELTDELLDSIISAMDNQDEVYVVDAAKGVLVQRFGDEQNYYSLPEWKPADGFSIRESFVNELHAPLAREELQNVLHSGRGCLSMTVIISLSRLSPMPLMRLRSALRLS